MPRCPDCNKFVRLNAETEPEVDLTIELEETSESTEALLTVTGSIRIVNTCAECGGELTEASFDIDETELVTIRDTDAQLKDVDYRADGVNRTTEASEHKRPKITYGFAGTVVVSLGKRVLTKITICDSIASGGMDDMT